MLSNDTPESKSEKKILIVDDSAAERLIIKTHIAVQGYDVIEAHDGRDALAILKEHPVELIISDWMMPGMDGIELCQAIRNTPGLEATYLIMLTGKSEGDHLIEAFDAGVDDFLPKPVNKQELRVRLNAGLRICRLRSRIADQLELIQADLRAAGELQRQMLPPPAQEYRNVEVASFCEPAIDIGGDLLNCFQITEIHIAFYVLDVCGHGAASAMHSFRVGENLNQMLKRLAPDAAHHPHRIIERLNEHFIDEANSGRYFTINLAILNLLSGDLYVSQAAQPPALHVSKERGVQPIENGGMPVGVFKQARYESTHIKLSPGDSIVIYTDGLTECENEEHEQLGTDRVESLISNMANESPSSMVDALRDKCVQWNASTALDDDLSILVLKRLEA